MNPESHIPPRVRSSACEESPAAVLLRQWHQGQEPHLDEFVAAQSPVSPRELADMIRVDLDAHWERGQCRYAEGYLNRFAPVAADPELAVDVIYAEFLAREHSGERPDQHEYQRRFPELAEVIAEQIGLHAALDSLEEKTRLGPDEQSTESDAEATYEILEQIGAGGMGVVFRAHQAALHRFVALKMVRAIDATNPELLARFRSEARVVASLRHPHIVQVFDCGEHEGLPYLAMELVEGGTLADRLDGSAWPPRAAAELLVTLAEAMQYAHDRQVIHRDLKPANVLVVSDGRPLDVKITDFGLAKLLADESSQNTKTFSLLGTPSYMAPEQASGRTNQIGPAADVYSLGAIFYELLTGRPPFVGETPLDTLQMLSRDQPAGVRHLAPHVPRDLATICEKCIERDADRRYRSAEDLQADLQRYLHGEPVKARKVGSAERAWRWCRRNPLLASSLGIVAALLVGITVVSLAYSDRLRGELARSRDLEQAQRAANESAQQRLWDSYVSGATAFNGSHRMGQRFAALDLVDKAAALLDTVGRTPERELQLRNAVLSAVTLPDVHKTRTLDVPSIKSAECALSIPGNLVVIRSTNGALHGHRWSDGAKLWSIDVGEVPVQPLFSRNGKLLAAISSGTVTVFQVDQAQPKKLWHAEGVEHFTFSPDATLVAYSFARYGMCLAHAESGQLLRTLGSGPAKSDFAFDPHGSRVAVCGATSIQIIDCDTGEIQAELSTSISDASQLAWHPGGEFLVGWTNASEIDIWNVDTRKRVHALPHRGMPSALRFNSDGSILLSATQWNQRLAAWDIGTTQRLMEVTGFICNALEATVDGRLVFLALHSDSIDVWELTPGACHELAQSLDTPLGYWGKVAVSPEGRLIALSSQECLELWDAQSGRRLWGRRFGDCSADFDSTGRLIVGCKQGLFRFARRVDRSSPSEPGQSTELNEQEPRTVVHFDSMEKLVEPFVPWSLSLNASGKTAVLFEDHNQPWLIVDTDSGRQIAIEPEGDARRGSITNDNRFVALSGWEQGGTGVWDAQSGNKLAELKTGPHGVPAFSPDGKFLATTPDGVTLWRTDDWNPRHQLNAMGTTPAGLGLAFFPDSRALAIGHVGGAISLVDTQTGKEFAKWSGRDSTMVALLAFSSDERWLVTSSTDLRTPAQVWNLVEMRQELAARGLDWPRDTPQPANPKSDLEGRLEVVIDDGGHFVQQGNATGAKED